MDPLMPHWYVHSKASILDMMRRECWVGEARSPTNEAIAHHQVLGGPSVDPTARKLHTTIMLQSCISPRFDLA